jgi:hypothetical protein
MARFGLGNVYLRQRQGDRAAECYAAALRHDPELAEAIGVFIRGDGYGGAGKGERGASDPA